MNRKIVIMLCLIAVATGCAPRYACKENIPNAKCTSLSETYAEEVLGEKPAATEGKEEIDYPGSGIKFMRGENAKVALIVKSHPKTGQAQEDKLKSGPKEAEKEKKIIKSIADTGEEMPILRPPKIARIWIAPWIDGNGDLYMESYIYTEIEGKRWIIGDEVPGTTKENMEKAYNPLK
jgi:type IV conjugative transfer system lipoprotein TraV